MQASILNVYSNKTSNMWHVAASKTSMLWEDDDFETYKLNTYCVRDILPRDKSIIVFLELGLP